MVSFKLCIADPQKGRAYQKEVKDAEAQPFIGMNVKETVKGELIGLPGFEFKITGGSDKCGFPMRHGILGIRKKINMYGGVGFSGKSKKDKRLPGLKRRKTVCGHKINENISQINMTMIKEGAKKLNEALGVEDKVKEKKSKKEAPNQAENSAEGNKAKPGAKK